MSIQRQRMEVAVAAILAAFSGAVILGSLQLAHGWGPRAPSPATSRCASARC